MSSQAGETYNEYWSVRDLERSRLRSLARAKLALRLLSKSAVLPSAEQPVSVLDVGCGPGWALEQFVQAGYSAKGLEVSEVAADLARERGLEVRTGEWGEAAAEGTHDVVVALEVLEHLYDPLEVLEHLITAMRPDGYLLISLPNEFHLLRRLQILIGQSPGWLGHDDPHIRHFHPQASTRLFKAARLKIVRSLSDDVLPPRLGWIKRLIGPCLAAWPSMFSLSDVFLLQRASE